MIRKAINTAMLILMVQITFAQVDVVRSRGAAVSDSLKILLNDKKKPIASLQNEFKTMVDSLDQDTLGKIEKEIATLNHKLDSVSALKLPSAKYKQKADSLYKGFQEKVLGKYKMPSDNISPKIKVRVSEIDKKITERTSLLDSLFTANGLDVNFNLNEKFNTAIPLANIPAVNTPGLNLPTDKLADLQMPNVSAPQVSVPEAKIPDANLPKVDLPKAGDIPGMDELKKIQEKVSTVTDVVKDAEKYAEEIKKVQEMDVKSLEKVPELAEKQLTKIEEVGAAQTELAKTNALKKEMEEFGEKAMNPDEVKEEVLHRTKQPFVDYLKGHESKVQSGMDQMSKYQKKYKVIADTRYLPKRTANKLKGKPWQERIIPGYFFQINHQLTPWTGIDISPYVGYRLSGRFRTFVGGTYRLYLNFKKPDINTRDQAFAFRWFTQVKTINGLYVHLELERKLEDLVTKPILPKFADDKFNSWQTSCYTGLMRLQRINKNLNGTFYALYDLKDIGETFNLNQIAVRFGLEYKVRKKKKPASAG